MSVEYSDVKQDDLFIPSWKNNPALKKQVAKYLKLALIKRVDLNQALCQISGLKKVYEIRAKIIDLQEGKI